VPLSTDVAEAADNSALASFRIPFGAIESGRGGAGLAAPGDGSDFLRNPALPAFAGSLSAVSASAAINPPAGSSPSRFRLHAAHSAWLFDTSLNHLAATAALASGQLSFAIQSVRYGSIERRGELPTSKPDGTFRPSDAAAALSYAYPLQPRLPALGATTAGITLRAFTQIIDTDRASGFALDFGLYHESTSLPLATALSLRHLGPSFGPGDDSLPTTFGAGLRFHPDLHGLPSALLLDALLIEGAPNQLLAGLELRPLPLLGLRVGHNFGVDAEGLSWGLDLLIPRPRMRFAYAFTAADYGLDGAHRFDLTLFY
jgi:hypothetical protein